VIAGHGDGLDVPDAQRPPAVHHVSLDHRAVRDQPVPVEGDRVHAAERVLPVVVLEVALEDLDEHPAQLHEQRGLELGRVGDAQHRPRVTEERSVTPANVNGGQVGRVVGPPAPPAPLGRRVAPKPRIPKFRCHSAVGAVVRSRVGAVGRRGH
jgi:hypothetical protein